MWPWFEIRRHAETTDAADTVKSRQSRQCLPSTGYEHGNANVDEKLIKQTVFTQSDKLNGSVHVTLGRWQRDVNFT